MILEKAGLDVTLSVPIHKELKRGTLRNLIKDAGLTVDELGAMLCPGRLKREPLIPTTPLPAWTGIPSLIKIEWLPSI